MKEQLAKKGKQKYLDHKYKPYGYYLSIKSEEKMLEAQDYIIIREVELKYQNMTNYQEFKKAMFKRL